MVETLVNVKNNKMRAIPGGEIAAEATQKMKRFLGGLTKKRHSEWYVDYARARLTSRSSRSRTDTSDAG